jgi:hypothetical protein
LIGLEGCKQGVERLTAAAILLLQRLEKVAATITCRGLWYHITSMMK